MRDSLPDKKRVLFLCTGNSCRSQMAEGFLRTQRGGQFDVFSAGIHPTALNPLAVRVMKEKGVDISGQHSKSVDEFVREEFDYVITVCDHAKETCPVFPGEAKRIHWSFQDPAEAKGAEEERLSVFRRVRDEIEGKIKGFVRDL